MQNNDFQNKLKTLIDQLQSVPESEKPRLEKLVGETRDRHERVQNSVKELQESLDYLRLSVKYLVFDLEATRRENAYLRGLLADEGQADHQQDDQSDPGQNGAD